MKKKTKFKCSCGKDLEVLFEGDFIQYPVFSCAEHGVQKNEWKKWWDIYSERWKERGYWDKAADKPSCILGYFCYKYKEFFGSPYTFTISSPIPYKSKDFIMARRLLTMFEGNAHDIRIFIKWMFAKKIRKNYPVTSLGFFTNANFINEYKIIKSRSLILKRHTSLPDSFLNWCRNNKPEIFKKQDLNDWNDLNILVGYIKTYGDDSIEGTIIKEAVAQGLLKDKFSFKKLED